MKSVDLGLEVAVQRGASWLFRSTLHAWPGLVLPTNALPEGTRSADLDDCRGFRDRDSPVYKVVLDMRRAF